MVVLRAEITLKYNAHGSTGRPAPGEFPGGAISYEANDAGIMSWCKGLFNFKRCLISIFGDIEGNDDGALHGRVCADIFLSCVQVDEIGLFANYRLGLLPGIIYFLIAEGGGQGAGLLAFGAITDNNNFVESILLWP